MPVTSDARVRGIVSTTGDGRRQRPCERDLLHGEAVPAAAPRVAKRSSAAFLAAGMPRSGPLASIALTWGPWAPAWGRTRSPFGQHRQRHRPGAVPSTTARSYYLLLPGGAGLPMESSRWRPGARAQVVVRGGRATRPVRDWRSRPCGPLGARPLLRPDQAAPCWAAALWGPHPAYTSAWLRAWRWSAGADVAAALTCARRPGHSLAAG